MSTVAADLVLPGATDLPGGRVVFSPISESSMDIDTSNRTVAIVNVVKGDIDPVHPEPGVWSVYVEPTHGIAGPKE